MPLVAAGGGLSALGSALLGGATAAATAGAGLIANKSKNKQEEKMATIDRTNAAAGGDQDFADQMAFNNSPALSLGAGRPVVYNKTKKLLTNTFNG